ncbi:MAG: uracil-DNA glycosylase family protein [Hyphomicrobium sp.]
MPDRSPIFDALALLAWQQAAGVDIALGADPIDWLARGAVPPNQGFEWPERAASAPTASPKQPQQTDNSQVAQPPHRQSRPQTPIAASDAEKEARRVAVAARSLPELEAALQRFDGCGLKATATKLCFFRGTPTARTVIIGEAPGRDEDLEGKPFVGRAGQLLDKMLASIGLSQDDVHITNVVYWRPPGNRTPTPQETLACRPFLERQIELVKPEIIIALGGSAAKEVLGVTEGIMRLRGKWRTVSIGGRSIPAIATLHPAYLLRTPAAKQLAWLDLLNIKSKLSELG